MFEDTITSENVAGLEVVWTATIAEDEAVESPVTSNDGVHVRADRTVSGFAPDTGALLWEELLPPDPGLGLPDLVQGTVVFMQDMVWTSYGSPLAASPHGDFTTELRDPATGEVIGTAAVGGSPHGARGDRYLVSREWEVDTNGTRSFSIFVGDLSDPTMQWGGAIDVSSFPGPSPEWTPPTLGLDYVYQAGPGFFRNPDDPIGVGRATNGIRGFSLEDDVGCGEAVTDIAICPTWFTELDGTRATAPVLDLQVLNLEQSRLFTGTDTGTVYAVDATTGDVAWSSPVGAAVNGEPALADGHLFVPTTDGRLVVLAAENGDILWQAQTANPLEGQPAVAGGLGAGGVVFTADDNGTVHVFDAAGCDATTCSPLWSAPTGSTITGPPAISQGQVYVGTADGRLIAYGLP